MKNIVFFGPPGSGKGTQAVILSNYLDIPAISTGDILRKEVSQASEIGKLAAKYMNSGMLVPDDVIIEMVKNRISLSDCNKGFILDGFPRNLYQGQSLDKILVDLKKTINFVFDIVVPDDFIVKRISGRYSCKNCKSVYNRFFNLPKTEGICDKCKGYEFESREDDQEKVVLERLKVYHENVRELVSFYRKKDLIYSIDGLKEIPLVAEDIKKQLVYS